MKAAQKKHLSRLSMLAPVIVGFAAATALIFINAHFAYKFGRSQAQSQLESAAELRATGVEGWLNQHMSLAYFLDDSEVFSNLFKRWQDEHDAAAGATLLSRLIELRRANGSDSAVIVDQAGNALAAENPEGAEPNPELLAAIRLAVHRGESSHSTIYRRAGSDIPLRMDVIVPLLKTGTPPRGFLVLRSDASKALAPILAAKPEARDSQAALWRGAGERVDNISDVATGDSRKRSVAEATLAASSSSTDEATDGRRLDGIDAGGGAVLSASRRVGGTDWNVVSTIGMDEVDAPARRFVEWSLLAAVMLMAGMAAAMELRRRIERGRELEVSQQDLAERVAARTVELQAANDALASSRRFNAAITEHTPHSVVYWSKDLRIQFTNRAFADRFGLKPEELVGRSVHDLLASSIVHTIPHLRAALGGEPRTFEATDMTVMGEQIHRVHYIPDRLPDGSVDGLYMMSFEITALKQIETTLQAANGELERSRDEARSATRAKSAFLANMSHEIRTPMNAIIGLSHLMMRDTRDVIQKGRIEKVSHAGRHLLNVINDILDLSKIEAGKLTLESVDFDLPALVSRAIELVSVKAREKGLDLLVEPSSLPQHLRGDPTRLSQILINLLSNAIKFTDHGSVTLRARGASSINGAFVLRFEVKDTGPGIAPEQQSLLFNAFEQADNSITRRNGGTGLGLAISGQLARAMGGEAGVTSAVGAGSTFWFTARLEHPQMRSEPAASPLFGGMRALLVDEKPDSRSLLTSLLRQLGLDVMAAGGDDEATRELEAELLAGRSFDLLLAHRVATLGAVRRVLGDGTPPAILTAASDDYALQKLAIAEGFNELLGQATLSQLQECLVRIGSVRRPASEAPSATAESIEATVRQRHGGRRVLLAEDNPINQEVAAELLSNVGLTVDTAETGLEALEMSALRQYDLVLMDMQMPEMDGLEAARRIRARDGHCMPIVAMTANAFAEDRAACLKAGMNDHVVKPVDPALLYETLLRWLPLEDRSAERKRAGMPQLPATAMATGLH